MSTDPEYLYALKAYAFEALPKHSYWRLTAQYNHPEATPDRIMSTLQDPTLTVDYQAKGRTAYYRYLEQDGIWFRVVLDPNGSLYPAFRDDDTMRKIGRP